MALSATDPVSPMLAKSVDAVPDPASVEGGLSFEPKWDGFRAIVYFDGTDVEITSRGSKPLTRYFPELVEQFRSQLPVPCVLDGEIAVRKGARLDWDSLTQRIHPADSRIRKLSVETPAIFVAFDLLEADGAEYLDQPFSVRRALLEQLLEPLDAPIHLTRTTTDVDTARRWLAEFEGAGLDGVVAKSLAASYAPGKRTMLKIKHKRTADVVVIGYRVHKSGAGVGSLLLGLYDASGTLRSVGGVSAFSDAKRLELVDELAPLVQRDDDGRVVQAESDRSRFSGSKDVSYVPLRPERVVEVRFDQMEGERFRHTVQFDRWRPDREARSCGYDQLEVPATYDVADVLG